MPSFPVSAFGEGAGGGTPFRARERGSPSRKKQSAAAAFCKGRALQIAQMPGRFRAAIAPVVRQAHIAQNGQFPFSLLAEGATAVGIRQPPEGLAQAASIHPPEQIPPRARPQFVKAARAHVVGAGRFRGLAMQGREGQTPAQGLCHGDTKGVVTIMMRPLVRRGAQFAEIVAECHPHGQRISRAAIHDLAGMIQYGVVAVPAGRPGGDARGLIQLGKPRPQAAAFRQHAQKAARGRPGQGLEQLPAHAFRGQGGKSRCIQTVKLLPRFRGKPPAGPAGRKARQPEGPPGIIVQSRR